MNREQIALRFPKGTKAWIKASALPGETMTQTILRALALLETAPQGRESHLDLTRQDLDTLDLPSRVDALEQRIAALEVISRQSRSKIPNPKREALVERIKSMRAEGMTNKAIAETLNPEEISTLSGRGQWQPGTVSNLLKSA